jgi:hypothetical protein
MTTKVSILEKKIEVLEEQVKSIRVERWKCQVRFQEALTRCFEKYFRGVVSEDVSITCTNTTIDFIMLDENCREVEIFQIYLREDYSRRTFEGNAYRDIQLSYYTTSTNSDFELERLYNLGRVAIVVKKDKEGILNQVNELAKIYDAELALEKFYERESEVEKQIKDFRNEIHTIKRGERKVALFSEEGLTFERGEYVRMKFNFEPKITKLKLTDISKSGKKATAVFTFSHGEHTSREENVDVEKIISQVI